MDSDLNRFINAQAGFYRTALDEVKSGRKRLHWMWFIFPQLKGLGSSANAEYYGIRDLQEAEAYLQHPILGKNLVEISKAVLAVEGKSALEIFGSPDELKLCSCMTLFALVKNSDPIFSKVIRKYFNGEKDARTQKLIQKKNQ